MGNRVENEHALTAVQPVPQFSVLGCHGPQRAAAGRNPSPSSLALGMTTIRLSLCYGITPFDKVLRAFSRSLNRIFVPTAVDNQEWAHTYRYVPHYGPSFSSPPSPFMYTTSLDSLIRFIRMPHPHLLSAYKTPTPLIPLPRQHEGLQKPPRPLCSEFTPFSLSGLHFLSQAIQIGAPRCLGKAAVEV